MAKGTRVFYLTGSLKDVVSQLAAVAERGGGAVYIEEHEPGNFAWLEPLLQSQRYILSSAASQTPKPTWYSLSALVQRKYAGRCLAVDAVKGVGGNAAFPVNRTWIEVDPLIGSPAVLVSWSPGQNHGSFPWDNIVNQVRNIGAYVGSENDWMAFCAAFGHMDRYVPASGLQLAAAVTAAKLVICDDSLLLSIAEATGTPMYSCVSHSTRSVIARDNSANWCEEQASFPDASWMARLLSSKVVAAPPPAIQGNARFSPEVGAAQVAAAGNPQWTEIPERPPTGVRPLFSYAPFEGKTFYHSGDIGDTLYAISAMKKLGGGKLFLGPEYKLRFPATSRVPYTAEIVKRLLHRLLLEQPYIKELEFVSRMPPVDFDLNKTRELMADWRYWELPEVTAVRSLAQYTYDALRLGPVDEEMPWLSVTGQIIICEKPIIANRTARYRNPYFPWPRLVAEFGHLMAFVGVEAEWREFCTTYGSVEWARTDDMLSVARVIKGSRLFIGNQSCPFAIAEGMKHPAVQETCLRGPDCIFRRPKVYHYYRQPEHELIRHVHQTLG